MSKFFIILCVLVLSIMVSSCTKYNGTENFFNVPVEYELYQSQLPSPNGSIPVLSINTLHPQLCKNAYISHSSIIASNTIRIDINQVIVDGACEIATISQPASANLLLDTPENNTTIHIDLQSVIFNSGKLKKSDDYIKLEMESLYGLKLANDNIFRIKPKMIWGFYSTQDPLTKANLDYFLAQNTQKQCDVGDYGFMQIFPNNIIFENKEIPSHFQKFAIFLKSDFKVLQDFINNLAANDSSLTLHFTHHDGQVISINY